MLRHAAAIELHRRQLASPAGSWRRRRIAVVCWRPQFIPEQSENYTVSRSVANSAMLIK